VAIVEVDPDCGRVSFLDYVVTEDCGVVINPMIVEGQVVGGVAQGIAAALYEELVFDSEVGHCVTSTLMDYLVPTVTELPEVRMFHLETPSRFSETGAKGMGEGGFIGAPAAVANAVSDAVAHLGFEVTELPIRPAQLVAAITGGAERRHG
jgi:carbon-monoxide dehydrogenase large subunit